MQSNSPPSPAVPTAGNPTTRVDHKTWEALVEAYRDHPGNHSHAARAAGVQRRTAKHAWDKGYPQRPFGVKPISVLIDEEQRVASSRVQLEEEQIEIDEQRRALEEEKQSEAARQAAISAKQEEGALVHVARLATIRTLAASLPLVDPKGTNGLGIVLNRLGNSLVALAAKEGDLTIKEQGHLSSMLRRYASTIRELTQAGQAAIDMQRVLLGEPNKIIGVQTDYDTAPLEDLVRLTGLQEAILKRAMERKPLELPAGRSSGGK